MTEPKKTEPEKPTTGHTINGKHTDVGHKVAYTGHDRQLHEATIDEVHPDGSAHLTAMVRGNQQKHTAVPHSADGGPHTWNHVAEHKD